MSPYDVILCLIALFVLPKYLQICAHCISKAVFLAKYEAFAESRDREIEFHARQAGKDYGKPPENARHRPYNKDVESN